MIRFQTFQVFALILIIVGLGSWGVAQEQPNNPAASSLPPDPITFQPGPGSDVATGYCLICHSAEYIYMQPPHSAERWQHIVNKMKHAFGCPIPEEQIPPLVKYLVSQNAIQPDPFSHNTPAQRTQSEETAASVTGDTARGKRVFEKYCVNCHGKSGKGDGPIGQSLIPPAADLTATGDKSDKELLHTIRHGRKGTAMPGWEHDLSSQDILDVLAHVRSLAH